MQRVKHHRGRMSVQGKNFLMNLDETDPNVIRSMFMRKFGRLITDKVIFKYGKNINKNPKSANNEYQLNHYTRTNQIDMIPENRSNIKRLNPDRVYMRGNTVRLSVGEIEYEIPVSLFSAEFIISLKDKVTENLKNQLSSLNGKV